MLTLTAQVRHVQVGVPIDAVEEVVALPALAAVPGDHSAILGVMTLRGVAVTVVDVGLLLGFRHVSPTPDTSLILVSVDGEKIACAVDQVAEIQDMPDADGASDEDVRLIPGTHPPMFLVDLAGLWKHRVAERGDATNGR